MSQVSATSSIEQTNAAYLARMQATNKSSQTQKSAGTGFASELSAVQSEPLPAPAPLTRAAAPKATTASAPASSTEQKVSEAGTGDAESDFGFDDFIDLINPLQHIPLVGTIYRELTGDAIKPEIQVIGSIGFGLATGSVLLSAASGIASAIFEQENGEEPTVQIARAILGDESDVQLAQNDEAIEGIEVADASAALSESDPLGAIDDVAQANVPAAAAPAMMAAAEPPALALPPAPQMTPAPYIARMASANQEGVNPAVSIAQSGGMRIGNTVYASPQVRSAAKVVSEPVKNNSTVAATSDAPTAPLTETSTADRSLGTLIHEQAKAQMAGQTLPPELIQDMMLKAYGKYSAAQQLSGDEAMMAMP